MSKKYFETNRDRKKVLKKIEGVQNCYDEICEEIEDEREWSIPSQMEGVISSI